MFLLKCILKRADSNLQKQLIQEMTIMTSKMSGDLSKINETALGEWKQAPTQ